MRHKKGNIHHFSAWAVPERGVWQEVMVMQLGLLHPKLPRQMTAPLTGGELCAPPFVVRYCRPLPET